MRSFLTSELSTQANKWQSRTNSRWSSPGFDAVLDAAAAELEPGKRAARAVVPGQLLQRIDRRSRGIIW